MKKSTIWIPFVAGAASVLAGRQVGLYTSAGMGFAIPTVPPGMSTSLYDGRFAGGVYGGLGGFVVGWVFVAMASRDPKFRNPWLGLGLSIVAGLLFAAAGAYLEGVPAR